MSWLFSKDKIILKVLLCVIGIGIGIGILAGTIWYVHKGTLPNTHTQQPQGVSVDGNHLLLNGAPFIIKGVKLVAFEAPPFPGYKSNSEQIAQTHFGVAELQDIKKWNANTIVFSVTQPALDPQAPAYSQAYITQLTRAIKLARSMGFVVIVHIADHDRISSIAGAESNVEGMPDQSTLRADETVGKLFGSDMGVIIEVYTEPHLTLSPENWKLWQNGGQGQYGEVLGMQTIINTLRANGVKNVLAIDGLLTARSFSGAPLLTDPLNEFFYAVHPYLNPATNSTPAEWQANFGNLSDEGHLVVATEWTEPTSSMRNDSDWCNKVSLVVPQEELDYLASKHIGIVGHAFDVPNTIVTDWNGTPTTYVDKKCGDEDGGPGVILQQQFKLPTPSF